MNHYKILFGNILIKYTFFEALVKRCVILLVCCVCGCAYIPSNPTSYGSDLSYEAVGRVAARLKEKNYTARFRWKSSSWGDEFFVFTALGNSLAKIKVENGKVHLITGNGDVFEGDSAPEITSEVLGWPLPVEGLRFWLSGNLDPNQPILMEKYDDGLRLLKLSQGGWNIEYLSLLKDSGLPQKMRLVYGDLKLRIIIDKWLIK